MDWSYDWINEARQRYSNTDFLEADTFVSRVSINWQENNVLNTGTLDYQILNDGLQANRVALQRYT
ncbi:hypothetical protein RirG_168650 [Rhizophagus irregularis DAOM 197198w]|uniref:Uncharacterized protein n=1 Tax=Rhizophagus irregularis (strain DAOM 197198w) TaxID=1432141 RepID=A0A015KPL4_RHIIW|nr:hypothetical protein RirG_168650 [Rhizophagus irregularis DAOM 197198w]